ncbi:MAG: hypothetical protein GYA15_10720 [Leptolinea sp.]|jgi:hypothetical protein|nr:hypothetical protein [Leptolinea sp.]
MSTPVDTWNYFLAGYLVIGLALAGYLISLALRWRHYQSRLRKANQIKKISRDRS